MMLIFGALAFFSSFLMIISHSPWARFLSVGLLPCFGSIIFLSLRRWLLWYILNGLKCVIEFALLRNS